MEELVYKLVDRKVKEMQQCNYDLDTLKATMNAQIQKYLETFKVNDTREMNLIKPSERDMFLYIIYLLQQQKHNDIDALNNIKRIIDFKIDVHNGTLEKQEIDGLIDLYKTQIKLK
jgi:hypothetical protein